MSERTARRDRRRALGQHFLVDPEVAHRAIAVADLEPGETVLEVGPGRGALTAALLHAGHPVVAVEIDRELARRLTGELGGAALTLLQEDFLRLDLDRLPPGRLAVIANLPYATGTAIVARLLEHPARFRRLVVMLQREVAERLSASPGSRAYGSLSVLAALVARVHLGFIVPPEAFTPRPQVESAVVRLDLASVPRAAVGDVTAFRRLVHLAFSQRRKTLRNALAAGLGRAGSERALERAGIDPARRAETLSLEEFARLERAAGVLAPEEPTGGGR